MTPHLPIYRVVAYFTTPGRTVCRAAYVSTHEFVNDSTQFPADRVIDCLLTSEQKIAEYYLKSTIERRDEHYDTKYAEFYAQALKWFRENRGPMMERIEDGIVCIRVDLAKAAVTKVAPPHAKAA